LATPYRIDHPQAFVAYSCNALICFSWVCHSDWQEQITANAADEEEPDVVGPNTGEPDAMESDVGCCEF
jgi:hypothetical protein